MNRNGTSECEIQIKFIQNRIATVERQFAELCYGFAQYSRKAAKIRNAGDELSKMLNSYAESEKINNSLQAALAKLSICILKTSDYCNLQVINIDKNVTNELSQYELICKHCKEDVKEIFGSREKELLRRKQLERIKERNPKNRQQIILAETELAKATSEVSQTVLKLEEKMLSFEQKKIQDIKTIFLNFLNNEIAFHSKVLEQFTIAYQSVSNINELNDTKEFKKTLEITTVAPNTKQSIFGTSQSLSALNLFSKGRSKVPGIPNDNQKFSRNLSKSSTDINTVQQSNEESEYVSNSDIDNSSTSESSDEDESTSQKK